MRIEDAITIISAVLHKDESGNLIRKAGVMGVVIAGGEVRPRDKMIINLPDIPFRKLERV